MGEDGVQIGDEKFWEVSLTVPKNSSAVVEEFILKSGAVGFHEILYNEGESNLNADLTRQMFYFPYDFPVKPFMVMSLAVFGLGEQPWEMREVQYDDFLDNMRNTFVRFEAAPGFWVIPDWELDEDQIENFNQTRPERFVVIKPAFAFGTGLHQTTRLMIETMGNGEYGVTRGDKVLDLGTGSGILSIVSLIMGASSVTGVDVESLSIEASYENLELNRKVQEISGKGEFYQGDFGHYQQYKKDSGVPDLFISNILPDVFIKNGVVMEKILQEVPRVILSGIVQERGENFLEWLRSISPERDFGFDIFEGWMVIYSSKT